MMITTNNLSKVFYDLVLFCNKSANFYSYLFYFLLISFLLFNTGIVSDDFAFLLMAKSGWENLLLIQIDRPLLFFSQSIFYFYVGLENSLALNLWKIFYVGLSFLFTSKFFELFLSRPKSLLTSFLFIFFPSHDSTTYWAMGHGYFVFPVSLYLYSFYLAHYGKLKSALSVAFVASFISYSTPPIALALFTLCILQKKYQNALVMVIPCVIYSIYFIVVTEILGMGSPRILESLTIYALIKQFILQILTFIDSMLGPSMWIKVYYSLYQLSIVTLIVGILLLLFIYKDYTEKVNKYNAKLLFGLIVMVVMSFGMFASTGRYPQLAFGLGNRTTTYGALLISYLIILIPRNLGLYVLGILIFSIVGISDHWKNHNLNQQKVIRNIMHNQELKEYSSDKTVYISGNQYSNFGPINHIEFMSENWVPGSILQLSLGKKISGMSINKRYEYVNGYLLDKKYNERKNVADFINVYNSEEDKLFKIRVGDINNYVDSLPTEARHWILLPNIPGIEYIKKIILFLMPRLEYVL